MHNKSILIGGLLVTLLLLMLVAGLVAAGPNALSLPWWTIDGGGGTGVGGNYTLMGTIGQPDAGTMSGVQYNLTGGFWSPADTVGPVFLPVIMAGGTP